MDIVYIRGLRVDAIVGIHSHERETPQPVIIDLEMGWDTMRAAASDRIDYALDYEKVTAEVTQMIQTGEYQLVERMADEIARMLTRNFHIPWLRLTVNKPEALQGVEGVGVVGRIQRQ